MTREFRFQHYPDLSAYPVIAGPIPPPLTKEIKIRLREIQKITTFLGKTCEKAAMSVWSEITPTVDDNQLDLSIIQVQEKLSPIRDRTLVNDDLNLF